VRRRRWPSAIAAFSLLGSIGFVAAMNGFRHSDVAVLALEHARATPEVVERLGEPIRMGWSIQGQISTFGGGNGEAKLSIPISGPNGSGVLRLIGVKERGEWRLTSLHFYGAWTSDGLDLLN
jgi:hypothetical protein